MDFYDFNRNKIRFSKDYQFLFDGARTNEHTNCKQNVAANWNGFRSLFPLDLVVAYIFSGFMTNRRGVAIGPSKISPPM